MWSLNPQVLTNLLSNAIKFTESGGIEISWKHVDEMVAPPGQEDTEIPEASCGLTSEVRQGGPIICGFV